MAITIQCRCGKSLVVDEKYRGKRGRCPTCGHVQLLTDDRYPPAAPADTAIDAMVMTDDQNSAAAPKSEAGGQPRGTYQVFLSHAAEDHTAAERICDALEAEGIRCWIAPRDIMPGKDWAEVIADAVDQCRGLILIYSPHSNASVHVRREVERAVGAGAFVIPLRIADVPMSKALGYFLHSCQWMDAHQPPLEKHLPTLVATVRSLLQKESLPAAPARLAQEAAPPRPARRMQRIAIIAAAVLLGIGLMGTIAVAAWRMNNPPVVAQQNSNTQTNVLGLPQPAPDKAPQAGGGSPGSGARAKPLEAGFSDVMLRGGPLTVRSDSISMGLALPAPPATPAAGPPPRQRVVAISDRGHTPLPDFDSAQHAILTVQLHNQSAEKVILSQAEFVLLGTVRLLEDVIPAPQPPTSLETPMNLVVEPSDSRFRLNYADLTKLFKDVNDPPSPLTYSVSTDIEGLVTPRLDDANRLHLAFAKDQGGTAYITVTARNAFDLASSVGFQVEVKKPVKDAAALTVQDIFSDLRAGAASSRDNELLSVGSAVDSPIKVEPKRTDLGRVLIDLSFKGNEVAAPISSGNLLPEAETTLLEPNSIRSLNLRVASRTGFELPSGSKDLLSGPGGRRLSMHPPKLEKAFQVGVVRVRITSESGSACDLFADKFYLLWTDGFADTSAPGQHRQVNFLSYVVEAAPDGVLWDMLSAGLRTNGETVGFLRAADCGLAPSGADEVSEYCLFGAPQHPLRTAGSSGSASSGQHQRSNLLPTLALIRQNQPAAWQQMQKQLTALEASEGPIASKAKYVKAGLANEGRQPELHRASVRVLAQ